MKTKEILWEELKKGDQFVDGSVVTELSEWSEKECYSISVEGGDPIIVSGDHIMMSSITNNDGEMVFLPRSIELAKTVHAEAGLWNCAEDIYYASKNNLNVTFNNQKLGHIEKLDKPLRVRCISTDTGHYEINGIMHHNTARKLFYALSDTQVQEDCFGDHSKGVLGCSLPGSVCTKCAKTDGVNLKAGRFIGSDLSTALSEPLTQLSLNEFHPVYENQEVELSNCFKKWSELEVGDVFKDGSIVKYITPWKEAKCYILKADNKEIILSGDHLLKAKILMRDHSFNTALKKSKELRNNLEIDDPNWLCVKDLYTFGRFNKIEECKINLLNLQNEETRLESIEIFDGGKPKKVRCITTDTGYYNINGFLNHNTGGKNLKSSRERNVIIKTFDAYSTSPIIAKAKEEKTTEGRRRAIYEGLKEHYSKNNIKMDDFNIMMIAKKMTSYINDPKTGKRYVKDGECCSISSVSSIGQFGNPFKKAELQSSYKTFTTPGKHYIRRDAAQEIIF